MSVFASDVNEIIEKIRGMSEELCQKSILITGASGMIGEMVVEVFLQLNRLNFCCDINVMVRKNRMEECKERWNDRVTYIVQDIASPILCKKQIDYIFHIAGDSSVEHKYHEPVKVLEANIMGTYHILEFARINHIQGILFVSSASVYGNNPAKKMIESDMNGAGFDPMQYSNCYAESKRAAECFCSAYGKQYGIPIKVVRPFLIYGSNLNLHQSGLLQDVINTVLVGEHDVVMKSDGFAVRNFCYITDCVIAMFFVLLRGITQEAYNVGSLDGTMAVKTFVDLLVRQLNKKQDKISVRWALERTHNQIDYVPDFIKLSSIGFVSAVSAEQGIARMLRGIGDQYGMYDMW